MLVLVRQRGPLFEAIIRALKEASMPVAGADRLVLTEHIAVMDLMALADALLLPDDDLALASVLKSPLFGLSEEQLFELAWDRKGSLRAACAQAKPIRLLPRAIARSTNLAQAARKPDAVRLLRARAGRESAAARNSWRGSGRKRTTRSTNSSIWRSTTSARETPSLQGFLAWLRAAPKRSANATWKWRATKCG